MSSSMHRFGHSGIPEVVFGFRPASLVEVLFESHTASHFPTVTQPNRGEGLHQPLNSFVDDRVYLVSWQSKKKHLA